MALPNSTAGLWSNVTSATLKKLFRRPAPRDPKLLLGLSPDQVDSLLQLQQHPGWVYYRRALEELAATQARPLLAGLLVHEEYLFAAGALEAIRRILALPDTLTTTRSKPDDSPESPGLDQFVNTPWYATARRSGTPG
jgi:hypothetical protein